MIGFLAESKQVRLSDKKIYRVKRAGIGIYYRFLALKIELYELYKKSDTNDLKTKVALLLELNAKSKIMYSYLKEFVIGKIPKKELYREIFDEIVSFNSVSSGNSGRPVTGKDIEEMFDYLLVRIIESTGWTYEYICNNVNNVQALKLIQNFNKNRIENVSDMRVAFGADKNNYNLHIQSLKGKYNPSEAMSVDEWMEQERKNVKANV